MTNEHKNITAEVQGIQVHMVFSPTPNPMIPDVIRSILKNSYIRTVQG